MNLPTPFTSAKPITFPCMDVQLVPAHKVVSNDYNPNRVASDEHRLLNHSIVSYGVTQPIVVVADPLLDRYVVVDGFHRYMVLTQHLHCDEIPVVVLNKTVSERMAATVRHNRARGHHHVNLMAALVASLRNQGWADIEIATQLGMEDEELLRLMQSRGLTGGGALQTND